MNRSVLIAALFVTGIAPSVAHADESACTLKVGSKAPVFSIPRADGEKGVVLKAALAKHVPVVVVFWAHYCAACQWELPQLQDISDRVGGKVAFLLIHDGPDESRMKARLAALKITLPSASNDSQDMEHPYCVKELPTTIVIDRKGLVRDVLDPPDMQRLRDDLVSLGVQEAKG